MAAKRGGSGRRLQLGLQLRKLRENCENSERGCGLTRKQAVHGLKISEATLQRIETGALNFRNVGDLRKLLEKYGIDDDPDFVESLVELNRDASGQDWLTQFRPFMPSGMPNFVGVETEAHAIRAYHPTVVYGLLQTENYAKALMELGKPVEETTSESIVRNVELRMERRAIIHRDPDPVRLWVILAEAALLYQVGDTEVMSEQYEEIVKLSALTHVKVQVLPVRSRGGYRSASDFTILDLGERLPPMVQIDTPWGAVSTSDKPREVGRFNRRFETMTASALPPEDTAEIMQKLSRELTSH
ncbi:helix-turn-helix domain-containing protein [Streptomyces sp. H27-D2]|uniref:helix-turn-helix domain-containing protein n=1 Tax=Streptomyces sp. H27-D2 TaxID=3046304 RepID=UPI002DBE8CBD|nr:helix-turn-helix transcriptional regulator [Streptomyces sp. H27-D2]MEC4019207.1 helix-turn-helix transcriptional regulator [Streptomyces sp. H27-D2]